MATKRDPVAVQALGQAIEAARAARDWTQVELAAHLSSRMGRSVSQSEISLWEAGKRQPTAGTLTILEDVLGKRLRPAA